MSDQADLLLTVLQLGKAVQLPAGALVDMRGFGVVKVTKHPTWDVTIAWANDESILEVCIVNRGYKVWRPVSWIRSIVELPFDVDIDALLIEPADEARARLWF